MWLCHVNARCAKASVANHSNTAQVALSNGGRGHEPTRLSDVQLSAVDRMLRKLDVFFNEDVSLLEASGNATLTSILDRIDIGERYGEKVYKAEYLDADKVQLPPIGEAGVVPIESVQRGACW